MYWCCVCVYLCICVCFYLHSLQKKLALFRFSFLLLYHLIYLITLSVLVNKNSIMCTYSNLIYCLSFFSLSSSSHLFYCLSSCLLSSRFLSDYASILSSSSTISSISLSHSKLTPFIHSLLFSLTLSHSLFSMLRKPSSISRALSSGLNP